MPNHPQMKKHRMDGEYPYENGHMTGECCRKHFFETTLRPFSENPFPARIFICSFNFSALRGIKLLPKKFIVIRLHYWIGEKPVRHSTATKSSSQKNISFLIDWLGSVGHWRVMFASTKWSLEGKTSRLPSLLFGPTFTSLCNKFEYKVIKTNEKQRNE